VAKFGVGRLNLKLGGEFGVGWLWSWVAKFGVGSLSLELEG
jgi:hypothetical protein